MTRQLPDADIIELRIRELLRHGGDSLSFLAEEEIMNAVREFGDHRYTEGYRHCGEDESW